MITSVELSNVVPNFIMAVNNQDYQNAYGLLRMIKSFVMIIKTQYGSKMDFSNVDSVIRELDAAIRWRKKKMIDLSQQLLYELNRLGVPLK